MKKKKSLNFKVQPDERELNQNLKIFLPTDLIEGPYAIFLDGKKNLTFDYTENEKANIIEIDLPEETKEMSIVGTKIVPEFGIFALLALGISISSILFLSKSRLIPKF